MQKAYLLADRQSAKVIGEAVRSQEVIEAALPQINQTLQQAGQYASSPLPVEVLEVVGQV